MVSLQPPLCDFGWKARPFDLPGVDGKRYTLENSRGKNGLLVMFICNHCPYVKSVRDRIIRDVRELQQHGINSIAIMSNDPAEYAEDSFDNMKLVAQQYNYPFPYVWDETQQVAKDYGDVQTNYKASVGLEKAYVNARRWLVTTFSNFDMGLGSIADIFQAFERYGVFRGDYLMALYNYNLSMAQLDKSTGAYRRKLPAGPAKLPGVTPASAPAK